MPNKEMLESITLVIAALSLGLGALGTILGLRAEARNRRLERQELQENLVLARAHLTRLVKLGCGLPKDTTFDSLVAVCPLLDDLIAAAKEAAAATNVAYSSAASRLADLISNIEQLRASAVAPGSDRVDQIRAMQSLNSAYREIWAVGLVLQASGARPPVTQQWLADHITELRARMEILALESRRLMEFEWTEFRTMTDALRRSHQEVE